MNEELGPESANLIRRAFERISTAGELGPLLEGIWNDLRCELIGRGIEVGEAKELREIAVCATDLVRKLIVSVEKRPSDLAAAGAAALLASAACLAVNEHRLDAERAAFLAEELLAFFTDWDASWTPGNDVE